jgi:hypothetical protein
LQRDRSNLLTGPVKSLAPKDHELKIKRRCAESRVIVVEQENPMGEANPHLDLPHPLKSNGGGTEE